MDGCQWFQNSFKIAQNAIASAIASRRNDSSYLDLGSRKNCKPRITDKAHSDSHYGRNSLLSEASIEVHVF
jgi:hypothetical protein